MGRVSIGPVGPKERRRLLLSDTHRDGDVLCRLGAMIGDPYVEIMWHCLTSCEHLETWAGPAIEVCQGHIIGSAQDDIGMAKVVARRSERFQSRIARMLPDHRVSKGQSSIDIYPAIPCFLIPIAVRFAQSVGVGKGHRRSLDIEGGLPGPNVT